MKPEDEFVQPCFICGKKWQRKDSHKWVFFFGILACKGHPGVTEWYRGSLKMAGEKLKLELQKGE